VAAALARTDTNGELGGERRAREEQRKIITSVRLLDWARWTRAKGKDKGRAQAEAEAEAKGKALWRVASILLGIKEGQLAAVQLLNLSVKSLIMLRHR